MAAWLDTSLETGACSDLILDWRDGGKQPSTRSVTFQHSALRSWFEEPDDKKAKASVCSGNDASDAEDNDVESLSLSDLLVKVVKQSKIQLGIKLTNS